MYGLFSPRFMILFIAVFNMIGALIMAGAGIYVGGFLFDENTTTVDPSTSFLMTAIGALIVAIGVSMFVRSFITFRFVKSITDVELYSNRWALIVLSLGLSSVLIPMLVKSIRPEASFSNAQEYPVRYYLGRWFSMTALLFGAAGLIAFGALGTWNSANTTFANMNQYSGGLGIVAGFFALYGVVFLVGFMAVPAFYAHNSKAIYIANESSAAGYMRFWGVFFTLVCTVMLMVAIISAVLEILAAVARVFARDENVLVRILYILNLGITILIQGYIIFTCMETIRGIWSRADEVSYARYSKLADSDFYQRRVQANI